MATIKRDFTPDKRAGLEKASAALARVLDFTLQNKIQQDRERKALEQVKFLQQKQDERHREDMAFKLKKLNDELAADKAEFDKEMDLAERQLAAMSKESDLMAKIEDQKRLAKIKEERHKAEQAKTAATIKNSEALNALRLSQATQYLYGRKAEEFLDTARRIETDTEAIDAGIDPTPYREEAVRQMELGLEFYESGGVIPPEHGPLRTGLRTGSKLLDQGVPEPQGLTPQENLLPFNFIDQSGQFSATPIGAEPAQPQAKPKRKKVDF
jgi:hypothetical protein